MPPDYLSRALSFAEQHRTYEKYEKYEISSDVVLAANSDGGLSAIDFSLSSPYREGAEKTNQLPSRPAWIKASRPSIGLSAFYVCLEGPTVGKKNPRGNTNTPLGGCCLLGFSQAKSKAK